MNPRSLQRALYFLTTAFAASACGNQEPDAPVVSVTKSALMMGNCVVPKDLMTAAMSYGHKSMAGNTASATAGDSLLAANNVNLGTFPAGTTVIVGFTGLGQLPGGLVGDTFIRLFDDYGQAAYNDDACSSYASRVVYTVPQGTRTLTARLGCYASGSCAGDLFKWTRLDSNGQLSDVRNAHIAINTGANAYGNPGPNGGSYGGTSVRYLSDQTDHATHYRWPLDFWALPDLVAPVQGGSAGYIWNGTVNSYSHFEGVQRLRHIPNAVAVSGAFRADMMFGYVGTGTVFPTAGQSWLSAGATANGNLWYRYSNYDVAAVTTPATDVTQFNHFGGIQTSGRYLVGGVSNYPTADPSYGRLVLLDAGDPSNVGTSSTMRKWTIDPETMAGNTAGIGPSQVGITKLPSGAFLMAMSQSDQTRFDFFLKDIDEATTVLTSSNTHAGFADIEDGTYGTPAQPNTSGWMVQNGTAGVVANGKDNDSIALVTQTSGDVFLLSTKWINPAVSRVQQVTLTTYTSTQKYVASLGPIISQNTGYQCTGSSGACNFMGAGGFYINSFDDTLELYSTGMYLYTGSPPMMGVSEFTSNMAYQRNVIWSSQNASYPPSNATNGNLSDVASTNVESSPWMFIDLGSVKTVTGEKISPCISGWGCTPPSNFGVYTWNGTWVQQIVFSGPMQTDIPVSLTFPAPVQTQYILTQLNGYGALQIGELQIY